MALGVFAPICPTYLGFAHHFRLYSLVYHCYILFIVILKKFILIKLPLMLNSTNVIVINVNKYFTEVILMS